MMRLVILAGALALAAPGAAQDGQRVQRLSSGVLAARAVERSVPVYPEMARAAGIEGSVVVEVTIDEAGRAISARSVSGHPLLRDAAVDAARGWVFEPTMLNGEPVRVIGTITFNFKNEPRPYDGPLAPVSTEKLYQHLLGGPMPEYPVGAARERIEGMVQVRLTVSPDGRVTSAVALSGADSLLAPASEAAERWRFRPIMLGGEAVGATGDVFFLFEEGAVEGRPVLENGATYGADGSEMSSGLVLPHSNMPGAPEGVPGGLPGGIPGGIPGDASADAPRVERPEVVRVSGGVLAGRAIERPQPEYPSEAAAAGVEGSVVVEVILDEEGRVTAARAVSGHPLLRAASVRAAREWVFAPTQLEGTPIKVIGTITFNFSRR